MSSTSENKPIIENPSQENNNIENKISEEIKNIKPRTDITNLKETKFVAKKENKSISKSEKKEKRGRPPADKKENNGKKSSKSYFGIIIILVILIILFVKIVLPKLQRNKDTITLNQTDTDIPQ